MMAEVDDLELQHTMILIHLKINYKTHSIDNLQEKIGLGEK